MNLKPEAVPPFGGRYALRIKVVGDTGAAFAKIGALRGGVASTKAFDIGLVPPVSDVTIITTRYCVTAWRPSKVAVGVTLVTLMVSPPPSGLAENIKLAQGPPPEGGTAAATPCVGPVAATPVSVGAAGRGVVSLIGAEAGEA